MNKSKRFYIFVSLFILFNFPVSAYCADYNDASSVAGASSTTGNVRPFSTQGQRPGKQQKDVPFLSSPQKLLDSQEATRMRINRIGQADLQNTSFRDPFEAGLRELQLSGLYTQARGGFKHRVDNLLKAIDFFRDGKTPTDQDGFAFHPGLGQNIIDVFHQFIGILLLDDDHQARFYQEHLLAQARPGYSYCEDLSFNYYFWSHYVYLLLDRKPFFVRAELYKIYREDFQRNGSQASYFLKDCEQIPGTSILVLREFAAPLIEWVRFEWPQIKQQTLQAKKWREFFDPRPKLMAQRDEAAAQKIEAELKKRLCSLYLERNLIAESVAALLSHLKDIGKKSKFFNEFVDKERNDPSNNRVENPQGSEWVDWLGTLELNIREIEAAKSVLDTR